MIKYEKWNSRTKICKRKNNMTLKCYFSQKIAQTQQSKCLSLWLSPSCGLLTFIASDSSDFIGRLLWILAHLVYSYLKQLYQGLPSRIKGVLRLPNGCLNTFLIVLFFSKGLKIFPSANFTISYKNFLNKYKFSSCMVNSGFRNI